MADYNKRSDEGSFWSTTPGCLTGIAGIITAIGGLIAVLYTTGILGSSPPPSIPPTISVDTIAGSWTGTIKGLDGNFSADIALSIQTNCTIGAVCGTYSVPSLPCSGNLILDRIDGGTFIFIEQKTGGEDWCGSGGSEYLNLLLEGTLSWGYSDPGGKIKTTGVLSRR